MKSIKKLFVLFGFGILFLLFLAPHGAQTVKAADLQSVSPLLYSIAQEEASANQSITASNAANLTPQQLIDIVFKAQTAGMVESIGTITLSGTGYKGMTGITGTAIGQVPAGTYTIASQPVAGVTMTLPSRTMALSAMSINTVDIAMKLTSGGGRVAYRSAAFSWKSFQSTVTHVWTSIVAWVMNKPTSPIMPGNTSQAVVVIRLYQDANNNGKYDDTEKLVPWANVPIMFTRVSP
ncbi:MAG TPA: hypothetical protein VMR81_05310 [Patescibacteria group bacterium]|jgi:hypothetical protein|nr:hypothetical protein [Patescibacteria group bacterium]